MFKLYRNRGGYHEVDYVTELPADEMLTDVERISEVPLCCECPFRNLKKTEDGAECGLDKCEFERELNNYGKD